MTHLLPVRGDWQFVGRHFSNVKPVHCVRCQALAVPSHSQNRSPTGSEPHKPAQLGGQRVSTTKSHVVESSPIPQAHFDAEKQLPAGRSVVNALSDAFALPRHLMEDLLLKHPALLFEPPADLKQHCTCLAAALQLDRSQVGIMVVRMPSLLYMPPRHLQLKIKQVAAQFRMPFGEAAGLVARQPGFLCITPERLLRRCRWLGVNLGIRTKPMAGVLARMPTAELFAVLEMRSDDWRAAVRVLQDVTGLHDTRSIVADMVATCPTLLVRGRPALAASHAMLSRLLVQDGGQPPRRLLQLLLRCPVLLTIPAADVQQRAAHLGTVLGLDRVALARRLSQQPFLLRLTPWEVDDKVQQLAETLEMNPQVVRRMLANQPQLMGFTVDALATKLTAISSALRLPLDDVRGLACAQPALLSLSSSSLGGKLVALAAALGLAPDSQQLATWVTRNPSALTLSEGCIADRPGRLAVMLSCSGAVAMQLLLQHPRLMNVQLTALSARLVELGMLMGMPRWQLRERVVRDPGLLWKRVAGGDC